MVFEWTPELSVNEEIIDMQHQQLLGEINALFQALSQSSPKLEKVNQFVFYLEKYVTDHLVYEEKYMQEHGYPVFPEHKVMHEGFVEFYNAFKKDLAENGPIPELALKVQKFIGEWWINHIKKDGYKQKMKYMLVQENLCYLPLMFSEHD